MKNTIVEKKAKIDGYEIAIECAVVKTMPEDIAKEQTRNHYYHYHDYIEVNYILSGTALIFVDESQFTAHEGDLVVINSRESHALPTSCDESLLLVIKFMPQLLYASDFSVFEVKYMMPFVLHNAPWYFSKEEFGSFPIQDIINNIFSVWSEKQICYELLLRSYILQLFSWIIKHLSETGKYDFKSLESCTNGASAVRQILTLDAHTVTEMTCAEAAEYCNVSYSYFSRVFKQIAGMSYKHYLLRLRVSEADRLLSTTDKTISEIARETGFSSDAYFIQCFRELKGVTPKKYRQKLEEPQE